MTYAYPQENSKSLKLTLPQSLADELDRIAQERFTSRLGLILRIPAIVNGHFAPS